MVTPATARRLVLLRHAKSAWPHGVPDHDRPLAGKGRRNAFATGQWFAAEGPRIDLALCSDAQRALHTWEIVRGFLDPVPMTRIEPRVYGADVGELLDLLAQTPSEVQTVLMIGHEPTMSSTTLALSGNGSDPSALERVARKFPTNGIAVLRASIPWTRFEAGACTLETFAVPRAS
jgi:phosphohistidine phosphatase